VKKKLILTLAGLAFAIVADAQGIKFEHDLTWEQVKEKAKAEHKYIFVDVYATWCGPCKLMDTKVYTKKEVGDYLNSQFISVKVQMDTSKKDDDQTIAWYETAKMIKQKYEISSLPTFLYFTPDGQAVHRFSGAVQDTDFIDIAKSSKDPAKQYYTLLDAYNSGAGDYASLRYLVNLSKQNGFDKSAAVIARDYISHFLNLGSNDTTLNEKNIEFITHFYSLLKTTDKYFATLSKNKAEVDSSMSNPGLAQSIVEAVVDQDEVRPLLYDKNKKPLSIKPNWNGMMKYIRHKYDLPTASRVVLSAQLRWYNEKKDWTNIVKYSILEKERYGIDTSGMGRLYLNNFVYEVIFKHSNDRAALNKGIKWMEQINHIAVTPGHLDTYASLLYKAGRFNEAIAWETKATKMDQAIAVKKGEKPNPNYQMLLQMMKERKRIWDLNL
jgi:thioredoxin-related protein